MKWSRLMSKTRLLSSNRFATLKLLLTFKAKPPGSRMGQGGFTMYKREVIIINPPLACSPRKP